MNLMSKMTPPRQRLDATSICRTALCSVVIIVSAVVLVGWALDLQLLKTVLPGRTTMKVNAALGLIAAGVSLWLLPPTATSGGMTMSRVSVAGGAIVVALGVATLIEYVLGVRLGIDELLLADPATTSVPFNGRMSPATSAAFVCLGCATILLTGSANRAVSIAHWMALPPATVGIVSLIGYAYGVENLHSFGPYVSVALNTAFCLCALSGAVLLTRSDEGCARIVVRRPASQAMFIKLFPWSFFLPVTTGLIVMAGVRAGVYAPLFALSVFAAMATGGFVWVSWLTAKGAVRIETALVASEQRFRQVAETMPCIVLITDKTGGCAYTNVSFQKFSGSTKEELLGDGWLGTVHPQDAEVAALVWRTAALTGTSLETEFRVRRHDGVFVAHLGRSLPLRDEHGNITGWFGACTDIQELVDARDALSRKNDDLAAEVATCTAEIGQLQKMDAIGQLTGGIAHDFNNLLTPVMGCLDLLQKRLPDDDERAQRTIETALQATSRAATLVQRLLAFARRQDLQPRVIDVGKVLVDLEDLATRSLGGAAQLDIEAEPNLPFAKVDPHQLELAILNLAINGRDAMPGGGLLTIRAYTSRKSNKLPRGLPVGDYICVSVTDTGIGMDAETLRRAPEPFFSTKGVGKGSGLGLSMAHGLAAQSGGTLVLRSTQGHGTTAEMWLPSTEDVPEEMQATHDAGPVLATAATILLVDDEELVRVVTAEMLEDAGYTVVAVGSGAEAMRHLRDGALDIDLLVTDFLMPGMNGAELAGQAERLRPGLPMLLVTGYSSIEEGPGMHLPRLSKPFRESDLTKAIARLLGRLEGGNVVRIRQVPASRQIADFNGLSS